MREIVSSSFAKEVQLDRPARTFGERVFRFSLYFFVISSALGGFAELCGVDKKIGDSMRFMMWPFSITFLFCFFYMLVYAGYRFAPRRRVTWKVWLLILGVPTAAVVVSAFLL
jgi:uncharacterized BrkB/YihY/UPF0761 family membrane protein